MGVERRVSLQPADLRAFGYRPSCTGSGSGCLSVTSLDRFTLGPRRGGVGFPPQAVADEPDAIYQFANDTWSELAMPETRPARVAGLELRGQHVDASRMATLSMSDWIVPAIHPLAIDWSELSGSPTSWVSWQGDVLTVRHRRCRP